VLVEALRAQADHDALLRFLPTARVAGGFLAAMTPTCDRAEGLARAAAGDTPGADALLARAIDGFDRLALPLESARTREHLAEVRPDRATELRRGALDTYVSLGAAPDVERIRAAMAAGRPASLTSSRRRPRPDRRSAPAPGSSQS